MVKEHSGFVNEELLLFFFKIDLGTRLQRALNLDRYEDAQALRAKIEEARSYQRLIASTQTCFLSESTLILTTFFYVCVQVCPPKLNV